jgi:hypothetical protein
MKDELERILEGNGCGVIYITSRNLPEGTVENHGKPQAGFQRSSPELDLPRYSGRGLFRAVP